ncbi:unnamed protein product [Somion occarium]|uniref:Cytochrome P450 n=2 Tax=Somion occarium TaxID=3059160 RepID=A0ABP1D6M0_9APHY
MDIMSFAYPALALGASVLLWYLLKEFNIAGGHAALPPGPPRRLVIGNLLDIPETSLWKTLTNMAQSYGDVLSLKVFSQPIVVLSSLQAATDLFDKRAAIYSDRYTSVMMHELCNAGWIPTFMNYGDRWRNTRKIYHQYFGPHALHNYKSVQDEKLRSFLRRLRDEPEHFNDHILYVFGATIMKMMYGIEVQDSRHEEVVTAEQAMSKFAEAGQPGRWLVDMFSPLKYVPEWFPGAQFKKLASLCISLSERTRNNAFNKAKQAYESGHPLPCIVTDILEKLPDTAEGRELEQCARDSLGSAFAAGSDTTVAYVKWFFLAMLMHPEAQKKAQQELDRVVGPDRLPDVDDRASLPYTEAVIKEVLRWQPVAPLAFTHCTAADDEYRGYHIPKGTIVIGNAWSILHDTSAYPDPESFMPERFLNPDGSLNANIRDPQVACFGFGRRTCPGRYLAMNSLYQVIASVLHTFNISPSLNDVGRNVIPSEVEGLIFRPLHYDCSIKPRSTAAEVLIAASDDL